MNIIYFIQTSVMNYLSTGVPIIDSLLLIILTMLFKNINDVNNISNNIFNIFKCKKKFKYNIELISKSMINNFGDITYNASDRYSAVTWYLLNSKIINSVKENYNVIQNDDDDFKKDNLFDFNINNVGIFNIKKDLYGFCDEYHDNNNNEKNINQHIRHNLILSSNKSLDYIEEFIFNCQKKYDINQKEKLKERYIYSLNNFYKNNEPEFNLESEIKYKCILETSIFDNKKIISDMLEYFTNKNNYNKHPELVNKLIVLLHGGPGTGKTHTIKLIVKYLNRHIVRIPLKLVKNPTQLFNILHFKKLGDRNISPEQCVFILDDIDCMSDVIEDREEKKKFLITEIKKMIIEDNENYIDLDKKKDINLTLSDILNTFDGVNQLDNYVIILTTNYIEKLDKALIRDQRITHNIKFNKCSSKILIKKIENWFNIKLNPSECSSIKSDTITLAQIVTICQKSSNYKEVLKKINDIY